MRGRADDCELLSRGSYLYAFRAGQISIDSLGAKLAEPLEQLLAVP